MILVYCLAVLAFVTTSSDLGLRFLLREELSAATDSRPSGLTIRQIADGGFFDPDLRPPRTGDRLVRIAGRPTLTFLHFAERMLELRSVEIPVGGHLNSRTVLLDESEAGLLPEIVALNGQVLVQVGYLRKGVLTNGWIPLRPLPWQEIAQTFIWFLLELGIFAVGALAFWARPFDRQARVFYAMCVVTLGGFVGGYHWWLIAGSLWLTVPFMVCAMMVPVVTLHFFLIYPEPKAPLAGHPLWTVSSIYAIPVLWTMGLVGVVEYAWWIFAHNGADPRIPHLMRLLDDGIYIYLRIAAAYFLLTLVALINSFFSTRNAILHNQVKWILWAAVVATLPVGYSLYLAHFQKERFALGSASFPMFTASLLFMLAYAVGIVRYKLMLIDEILSRGMVYYILSVSITAFFSLAIALSSLAGMYRNAQLAQQMPVVIGLVVVAVLLLNWSRDRLQELIDRRFFREKFQLDKALQRMNQSAGGLADPEVLGRRMLSSCLELLGVEQAALYLRDAQEGVFRLIAAEGMDHAPRQFAKDQELLSLLDSDPNLHLGDDDDDAEQSQTQMLLRQLEVDLVHALEMDGHLAGVLMLGAKRNGTRYTAEDLALLASLGQITSVALYGARVHRTATRLNEELQLKLEKISEQQRLISMLQAEITSRQQVEPAPEGEPFRRELIKGSSPAIRSVLETVRKVSGSQSSVLVRGESGTGKELLAQAIHDNSSRRGGPMVSVHCGALSPGLLESELFGHVKGSFTGAHRDKVGRFEMADGGTLFLDEIGDISLDTQIKLLRVLQEREFEPVGGTRALQVDVRLIAATHQNLERLIAEGKFREDLFYRLNVISITLPPLRERADDIIELALHFLTRAAERAGKRVTHFEEPVMDALRRYPWPGNIRELENAIERSVVMAEGPAITLSDLPAVIIESRSARTRVLETKPISFTESAVTDAGASVTLSTGGVVTGRGNGAGERQRLVDALIKSAGNKAEAARLLGLPRSTFFSKLKKFGIE
ncbi:MAG TPA: sigma 54-interacting transcriptional regulator [Planctomycetaceae bacterium]|nr:sigma 54-interacting transcriptional regulator [Planctomycetaceae bacterium]